MGWFKAPFLNKFTLEAFDNFFAGTNMPIHKKVANILSIAVANRNGQIF